MSAPYLGDFAEDGSVYFIWSTNDSDGASITRATDGTVSVYKNNGATQSVAGVTDTEDFDSLTGIHACTIDLSSDAFYAVNADYTVVLSGATIDTQSVNAVLAHFSIENRTTFPKADYPTNFTSASIDANGRVDVIKVAGTTQTANDNGADINAILLDTDELQTDWTNAGRLDTLLDTVVSRTANFAYALGAGNMLTIDGWDDSSTLATSANPTGDATIDIEAWYVDPTTTGWQVLKTDDMFVINSGGPGAAEWTGSLAADIVKITLTKGTGTIPASQLTFTVVATNFNKTIRVDLPAGTGTEVFYVGASGELRGAGYAGLQTSVPAPVVEILEDTAEIGAAGAGLTNINLPNQTMDITGDITGNLSGSVGSVTGAVGSVTGNVGGNVAGSTGSVTGAVGSVTGNVGGNVTGSVGSVAGNVDGNVTGNVGGNVVGSVASVTGAVASVTGNVGGNVTGTVGSVVGAVGSVTGNLGGNVTGNVGGNVTGSVGSVASGGTVRKNTALAEFSFLMTDSTNHEPATGKTVTVTRSIDGAAFGGGTLSAVTELSNGIYLVDFAAADLNGNVITLRCTAADCDDTFVTLVTQQ